MVARRYDEKLGNSRTKAVEYFRRAQASSPRTSRRWWRSSDLYTRDERWSDLRRDAAEEGRICVNEPDRAARVPVPHRRASARRCSATPTRRSRPRTSPPGQTPDDLQALRALDRLYLARGEWRELGDNISASCTLVERRPARAGRLCSVRLGAAARDSTSARSARRSRPTRRSSSIEPEHRDAVAALERHLPQRRARARRSRSILEPIYKVARRLAAADRRLRDHGAPRLRSRRARSRCSTQIAELHEIGLRRRRRRVRDVRARAARGSANPRSQTQLERLARGLDKLDDLVGRYGQLAASVADDELKNALYHQLARMPGARARRRRAGGGRVRSRRWTACAARPSRPPTRSSSSTCARGDCPKLVELLQRKAEIVDDVDERKQRSTSARRRSTKRCSTDLGRARSRRSATCCRSTTSTWRRWTPLERLYVRLARWEPLKDVYAKKAELADDAGRQEADAVRARAGLRPRARRRREGDRDLPAHPRSRRRRATTRDPGARPALRQAERWYDLLGDPRAPGRAGAVAGRDRRRSSTASVTCGASTSRIWRARRRELPRGARRSIPHARADAARARRRCGTARTSRSGGARARADLRERAASGTKLVDVSR